MLNTIYKDTFHFKPHINHEASWKTDVVHMRWNKTLHIDDKCKGNCANQNKVVDFNSSR